MVDAGSHQQTWLKSPSKIQAAAADGHWYRCRLPNRGTSSDGPVLAHRRIAVGDQTFRIWFEDCMGLGGSPAGGSLHMLDEMTMEHTYLRISDAVLSLMFAQFQKKHLRSDLHDIACEVDFFVQTVLDAARFRSNAMSGFTLELELPADVAPTLQYLESVPNVHIFDSGTSRIGYKQMPHWLPPPYLSSPAWRGGGAHPIDTEAGSQPRSTSSSKRPTSDPGRDEVVRIRLTQKQALSLAALHPPSGQPAIQA